jgi:hypothetical protein
MLAQERRVGMHTCMRNMPSTLLAAGNYGVLFMLKVKVYDVRSFGCHGFFTLRLGLQDWTG